VPTYWQGLSEFRCEKLAGRRTDEVRRHLLRAWQSEELATQ
jgi:hypothetical protein